MKFIWKPTDYEFKRGKFTLSVHEAPVIENKFKPDYWGGLVVTPCSKEGDLQLAGYKAAICNAKPKGKFGFTLEFCDRIIDSFSGFESIPAAKREAEKFWKEAFGE